ncbi:sensor histidine kinase [Lacinutrix jangbogonensis]|uniref:sensor histidine kinase n=1 Tax=Lacinutrix jangbogonensis TaxID=1469557 RepID=UPI00053D4A45|nr:ATP-binding protein [Lacinutrix jangbogonensis]
MEIQKTYKFALKTALYITIVFTLVISVFLYAFYEVKWQMVFLFSAVCYILVFVIFHYRVKHFIYYRVKQIYEELRLLESSTDRKNRITTDMATLTEEIDKFARDKKIEIETLKIREEYRKEFLGNVSHELKTPLFTVQGYIETLIDGAANDKKIREKYLDRANKGVERLIYIVKDLDMITKLEVGDVRIEIETFNIIELIKSVFDLFEMKATKTNITLTFDRHYSEPIFVKADKEKIQQVLTNLVVNSIKYGRDKGTTEIGVENLIKNKVIIRVTDNGEGIEKENIPRLFERFYRVDKSGSRKEGGSGLGLAIVKHIIEAHDEKIYIESEFGVGSEFSFTLEKAE